MTDHKHTIETSDMIGETTVWPCGCSATWVTMTSHPASRLRYQTLTVNRATYGRVTKDGHEVVSPAIDSDDLYRQYTARVDRAISEGENA